MANPIPGPSTTQQKTSDSWLARVRDNLRLLAPGSGWKISSSNGAPIHFLDLRASPPLGRSQSVSVMTHAALVVALLAWAAHPRPYPAPRPPVDSSHQLTPLSPELLRHLLSDHTSSGAGSGGNRDPRPATSGNVPALSSIQLLKPALPQKADPQLAVPPTILDAAAPPVLAPVSDIGLPWMRDRSDSAGPGDGQGIGRGKDGTMGDGGEGQAGNGTPGRYRAGVIRPACVYCPDPGYTDEARQSKVQGIVTLEVLVSADGRAAQIRVVKGIGMGLEERALQTVRSWRFAPARDAAQHAMPDWVTIEVAFRLY